MFGLPKFQNKLKCFLCTRTKTLSTLTPCAASMKLAGSDLQKKRRRMRKIRLNILSIKSTEKQIVDLHFMTEAFLVFFALQEDDDQDEDDDDDDDSDDDVDTDPLIAELENENGGEDDDDDGNEAFSPSDEEVARLLEDDGDAEEDDDEDEDEEDDDNEEDDSDNDDADLEGDNGKDTRTFNSFHTIFFFLHILRNKRRMLHSKEM